MKIKKRKKFFFQNIFGLRNNSFYTLGRRYLPATNNKVFCRYIYPSFFLVEYAYHLFLNFASVCLIIV